MPLTDTALKNAKSREKPYKLADSLGLFLLIQPNGGKWWRLKYRFGGKEGGLSLGTYPEVSLKLARQRRDEARELVARGINPGLKKQQDKQQRAQAASNTFEALAREWIAKMKPTWAASHTSKIEGRMEKDVFPYLGRRVASEIQPAELLAVLRRIEARGAIETAHRALTECGQAFRYGVSAGVVPSDPTRDLRGALQAVATRHHAAVTDADGAGTLMRNIENYRGSPETRAALKLSALLFQRPGEIRTMEWAQVDLDRAEWRYTVSKTKSAHVVPLSSQAVAVLADLRRLTGHGRYVLAGVRSPQRPMSENTVRAALRGLGYGNEQMTPHGFRAMARSLLAEMGWKTDAIERQLAHKAAGPLGAAYDRAQFLSERKDMMQAWADYLDTLARGESKVVPLKRATA